MVALSKEDGSLHGRRAGFYDEQIDRYLRLDFPLGEMLVVKGGDMMLVWAYWPGHLSAIKAACEPWRGGFSLVIGDPVEIDDPVCASLRLVPTTKGDIPVWFEIRDVAKARALLETKSDTPVPLVIDMLRYNDDIEYRHVCDTYHRYWTFWFRQVWTYGAGAAPVDLDPTETDEDYMD